MSLDVYLYTPLERGQYPPRDPERIFVRRGGSTEEITRAEWDDLYPGREPVTVLTDIGNEVYTANITHNLGRMADQVREDGALSLYDVLWRPDEHGLTTARQLIPLLEDALPILHDERERLEVWNPENGWGNYDLLVRFTVGYLSACREFPDAEIEVSR